MALSDCQCGVSGDGEDTVVHQHHSDGACCSMCSHTLPTNASTDFRADSVDREPPGGVASEV